MKPSILKDFINWKKSPFRKPLLLKGASQVGKTRYLIAWPSVDLDVKQKFQFGGIGALFGYEIDMLVTPVHSLNL